MVRRFEANEAMHSVVTSLVPLRSPIAMAGMRAAVVRRLVGVQARQTRRHMDGSCSGVRTTSNAPVGLYEGSGTAGVGS